ncbi:Fic family protein [Cryobacterium sp. 5B3]|nr:Fic family protein [Cryobacterium sp. 5B3]
MALPEPAEVFVDPYVDPATGILRNRVRATAQAILDAHEAELTALAAIELAEHPIKPTGDLRQLRAIHKRLLQDVYDWAGELRTVDLRKGRSLAAEFFMPVSRLESGAGFAFQELAEEHFLRGLEPEQFARRIAHHYDQVNYLHPFREGNGRAQRIFWTQIAQRAGYELDWRGITGAANDQASREAMEKQDLDGLREIFRAIVKPIGATK